MTSTAATWVDDYVKDRDGNPRNNLVNAVIALTRSPELRDAFGCYIADDDVYVYGPLLGSSWPDEPEKLTDRHVNSVRLHMQLHCDLPAITTRDVMAAIKMHADKNIFTYSSEESAHVYMWARVYDVVKPHNREISDTRDKTQDEEVLKMFANQEIAADWTTLMKQAPMTVHDYMMDAIRSIDREFGKGYAAKNPALVAAYLQACAADFHTTSLGVAAQKLRDAISSVALAIQTLQRDE